MEEQPGFGPMKEAIVESASRMFIWKEGFPGTNAADTGMAKSVSVICRLSLYSISLSNRERMASSCVKYQACCLIDFITSSAMCG